MKHARSGYPLAIIWLGCGCQSFYEWVQYCGVLKWSVSAICIHAWFCETGVAGQPGSPGIPGPGPARATGFTGHVGRQGATGPQGKLLLWDFFVHFFTGNRLCAGWIVNTTLCLRNGHLYLRHVSANFVVSGRRILHEVCSKVYNSPILPGTDLTVLTCISVISTLGIFTAILKHHKCEKEPKWFSFQDQELNKKEHDYYFQAEYELE